MPFKNEIKILFFCLLIFDCTTVHGVELEDKDLIKLVCLHGESDTELTNISYTNLKRLKNEISRGNHKIAYKKLMNSAKKSLKKGPFSVMQKTQTPPSGDKHDYISLGPYWWPDESKPDGLPWIWRDGEINPLTRGDNVDYNIKNDFFNTVNTLSLAHYLSGKKKFAKKTIDLLQTWFLDPDTKMNPNLNFAQGIPGKNTGRGIGIIEFAGIRKVITAIELLELTNSLEKETGIALRSWFSDYLKWLQTSEFGIFEKSKENNHGTWYDVQVASILIFLDREDEARELLQNVSKERIGTQIEPDGKQPHELKRTKALSYSTMNLAAFTHLAFLADKTGIDLWNYQKSGAGIKSAYSFLEPYARGEMPWEHGQLGDIDVAIYRLQKLFLMAGGMFNVEDYCNTVKLDEQNKTMDLLMYPCGH